MSVVNEICSQYLDALNRADLKKVLSLFEDDAVVISPLYGEVPVVEFYNSLFSDTQESKTRLLKILESTENHNIVALHFQFQWTLENGGYIDFECFSAPCQGPRNCTVSRQAHEPEVLPFLSPVQVTARMAYS